MPSGQINSFVFLFIIRLEKCFSVFSSSFLRKVPAGKDCALLSSYREAEMDIALRLLGFSAFRERWRGELMWVELFITLARGWTEEDFGEGRLRCRHWRNLFRHVNIIRVISSQRDAYCTKSADFHWEPVVRFEPITKDCQTFVFP
jgi:hypothetical protein